MKTEAQALDRGFQEAEAHIEVGPTRLTLREAKPRDIETMTALLRQLFTLEPDFAWNPRRQRAGLLAMLESASDRRVLVACLGDLVVGMVTLQCVVSTAEGGLSGWVEDVVVDSAWRGKGIGRWLLMALENWAKARGLTRLQLLADRENLRAMEFYARHGWQPTRMVAWRKKL